MKKIIILAIVMSGMIGCASNSRVDALANQLREQQSAIYTLQKAALQEESQRINIYNRIAGNEGTLSNHKLRLDIMNNNIQSLSSKFDAKFKQNALK